MCSLIETLEQMLIQRRVYGAYILYMSAVLLILISVVKVLAVVFHPEAKD